MILKRKPEMGFLGVGTNPGFQLLFQAAKVRGKG